MVIICQESSYAVGFTILGRTLETDIMTTDRNKKSSWSLYDTDKSQESQLPIPGQVHESQGP